MIRAILRPLFTTFVGIVFLTVALACGVVLAGASAHASSTAPAVRPCPTEDTGLVHHRCVWDARDRGNGAGHSFVRSASADREGTVRFISHKRAHYLLNR